MSDKKLIAPSMLAADFSNLARDIAVVNQSDADWFHLDVMDGVFVPNISFGMPVIKSMAKHTKKPLDVHLMIVEPDRYIQTFADLGADVLTVHVEACTHLHRSLQSIKATGNESWCRAKPSYTSCILITHHCRYRFGVFDERKPRFWWPIVYRSYLSKSE